MTNRKNPTRIALLVAAVMSLGTAGIAAAQPAARGNQKVESKRPGKKHDGKRGEWKARFDTNKDGVISPAEKNAMLRTRFAGLDLNKDGVLTAAEMHKAHAARMQGKQGKRGNQAANKRGKRGNGQAKNPAQRQARFAQHFARLDANKDGRVTFAEFAAAKHEGRKGHKGNGKRHNKKNRGQQSRRPAATPATTALVKTGMVFTPAMRAGIRGHFRFSF